MLSIFNQQSGMDGLMIYSNNIFLSMKEKNPDSIDPKVGSYILGGVVLLTAILSPIPVRLFKRKPLLLTGQLCMSFFFAAIGFCLIYELNVLAIVSMNLFIASFNFSQGAALPIYLAEVTVDSAMGLCIFFLFFSQLEIAITTDFIVQSSLGPQGMFFICSFITFLGAIFVWVFMKETSGLTDAEKKTLYVKNKTEGS